MDFSLATDDLIPLLLCAFRGDPLVPLSTQMHPTAPSTGGNPPTGLEPESPFSPFESAGQATYSTESPDKATRVCAAYSSSTGGCFCRHFRAPSRVGASARASPLPHRPAQMTENALPCGARPGPSEYSAVAHCSVAERKTEMANGRHVIIRSAPSFLYTNVCYCEHLHVSARLGRPSGHTVQNVLLCKSQMSDSASDQWSFYLANFKAAVGAAILSLGPRPARRRLLLPRGREGKIGAERCNSSICANFDRVCLQSI